MFSFCKYLLLCPISYLFIYLIVFDFVIHSFENCHTITSWEIMEIIVGADTMPHMHGG